MRRLAWLTLVGAAACGETATAPLEIVEVSPASALNHADVPVVIRGAGFAADVSTDLDDPDGTRVRDTFRAFLGDRRLSRVLRQSKEELAATVPEGLPPGVYELRIIDPAGREASLAAAFEALDASLAPSRAAAFVFDPIGAQEVGRAFDVAITAVDAQGAVVSGYDGVATLADTTGTLVPAIAGRFSEGRWRGAVEVRSATTANAITVTDAVGATGTSGPFAVALPVPRALRFASHASSVTAGDCSPPLEIVLVDEAGQLAGALAALPLSLVSEPAGVVELFAGPGCTSPLPLGLAPGDISAVFSVRSATALAAELAVTAGELAPDTHSLTVLAGEPVQLAVVTPPRSFLAGACSEVIVIEAQDALGNPAVPASPAAVEIAAAPQASSFSDPACSAPLPGASVGPDVGFVELFVSDTLSGSSPLSASSGSLAPTAQAQEVLPASPYALVFESSPGTVVTDTIIAPVEIGVRDRFGNLVPTDAVSITVSLDANPGGATLSGTATAQSAQGIATFADLSIDRFGVGYSLCASAPPLVPATCPAFDAVCDLDTDGDTACDAYDTDDDNDGVADGIDLANLDPSRCSDTDGDGCDDCAVGVDGFGPLDDRAPGNDGLDTDSDGQCDAGDGDDDNDGALDGSDVSRLSPTACADADADACDDCAVGVDGFGPLDDRAPGNDGLDTDGDGQCDAGDDDDDNDGVADASDLDRLSPTVCRDSDSDGCDDCAIGVDGFGPLADATPGNDGPNYDGDGLCNAADSDDDNDGVPDATELAGGFNPLLERSCADVDNDSCDDCGITGDLADDGYDGDPANDGPDADADGICGSGDEVESMLGAAPLGDATAFAFVFAYGGYIYMGPNTAGTGLVRVLPSGASPQSVSFAFARDAATPASNDCDRVPLCTPPYPSIGRTGCLVDSANCGPDNEDGRGVFRSGVASGNEWLVAGGANVDSEIRYLYLTRDTDTVLDFSFVRVDVSLGGNTLGISAVAVFGDRIYAGFPDSGGNRPYLQALNRLPVYPGFTATATEVVNLEARSMPYVGHGNPVQNPDPFGSLIIDWIGSFNGRLYVANNGGCMRSNVAGHPAAYDVRPSDWANCTPSSAQYTARTSLATSKVGDITPADKTFAQMAELGDGVGGSRLYAGRNTTVGPQLWVCTPATPGAACDPASWSLVAPNTALLTDTLLTQFDNTDNSRITLVLATSQHLYVGFDNTAEGVVLMRSTTLTPSSQADFEGLLHCSAADHDALLFPCEGLGGNGLGVGARRIYDATGMTYLGSDYLYIVAGDGSTASRVFRVSD